MNSSNNNPSQKNYFDRSNVENIFPLAPMQQGLLFHSLLAPQAGTYVPQIVIELEGALDAGKMRTVWQHSCDRHGILRTGYFWEQRDEPYQIQFRQLPIEWVEQDWQPLNSNEQEQRLATLLACNRQQPFKLQRPPLMRLFWLQLAPQRVKLVWCYHHLILDGWSAANLLQEVMMQYLSPKDAGSLTLPPPPPAYSQFVNWQQQLDQQAAIDYWQQQLRGLPALPVLPGQLNPNQAHGATETIEPYCQHYSLSTTDSAAITALCQQHQLTLNSFLQGALALLLRRYGNSDDILFGTTVAGRPAQLEQSMAMIGLFINTLPVRVSFAPELPLMTWLQQVQTAQQRDPAFEQLSLRDIQAQCNQGNPLFNCLLVLESYPTQADFNPPNQTDTNRVQLKSLEFDENTHFPLSIQVATGSSITLTLRADKQQFAITALDCLLQHYAQLLPQMVRMHQQPVGTIGLLTSAELQQRQQWNQTSCDWPKQQHLVDLFERQVEKTPDNCALVFGQDQLSYRSLNQQANALATALLQLGAGPEQVVAIYLPRSLELGVAIWGIQKTGAIWLAMDSGQPSERLEAMVLDAKPVTVIIDSNSGLCADEWLVAPQLDLADLAIVTPDAMATNDDQHHPVPLEPARSEQANPSRPPLANCTGAYLVYTSGSTGTPKGVLNTQGGIVNRLHWMQQQFQLSSQDRVLQKTPLSFDVSVWELCWPLITGATLVMAEPGIHQDRDQLLRCIEQQQISLLHFVPSLLVDFLAAESLASATTPLAKVRDVICSGEAVSLSLQQQMQQQLPQVRLHNLYGPAEAAIDVTAWYCDPALAQQRVPIGTPIANTQIHLLDADQHPVPVGGQGQLHIGGLGLARGYWQQPALTAARFKPDPFQQQANAFLYDTGDMARYRADGVIEYLGRNDDQIKIRGVRFELGEIEARLCELPGVQQGVVRILEDQTKADKIMVGYLVLNKAKTADGESSANEQQWVNLLSAQLPQAMIPSQFMLLDAIPLSLNGKPDRQQLPIPAVTNSSDEPATTPQQQLLADIWRECLTLSFTPGVNANFFHLGGHSLIATRIVNRVRKATGLELPLPAIFEHPTLAALANHLAELENPKPDDYREVTL